MGSGSLGSLAIALDGDDYYETKLKCNLPGFEIEFPSLSIATCQLVTASQASTQKAWICFFFENASDVGRKEFYRAQKKFHFLCKWIRGRPPDSPLWSPTCYVFAVFQQPLMPGSC